MLDSKEFESDDERVEPTDVEVEEEGLEGREVAPRGEISSAELGELIAKNPFSYFCAVARQNGMPEKILRAMDCYEDTDDLVDSLSKFIATLKKGVKVVYTEKAVEAMMMASSGELKEAGRTLGRERVRVNPMNARAILERYIPWEAQKFNKDALFAGKIPLHTKGGDAEVNLQSSEALYNSVCHLILVQEAGSLNYSYECLAHNPAIVDLVFFCLATYKIEIRDGAYKVYTKSYHGAPGAPLAWQKVVDGFLGYIQKRLPSGYNAAFQAQENLVLPGLLYNDANDYFYSSSLTQASLVKEGNRCGNTEAALRAQRDYNKWVADNFDKVKYEPKTILERAKDFKQKKFPYTFFEKLIMADRNLDNRRKNGEANFDTMFGLHTMGFEYLTISSHVSSTFTILYQVMYAHCWKHARLKDRPKDFIRNAKISIVLCGDQIKARAPILESMCQELGWKLYIPRDAAAPVGSYVKLFERQNGWHGLNFDKEEVYVYWLGTKDVPITATMPTTADVNDDDKHVMQTIMNYREIIVPTQPNVSLLVHHDLMTPAKMAAELKHLTEKETITLNMIPHPSNDSKSFAWFVTPKEAIPAEFVSYYAVRMVECAASMDAIERAVAVGKPKTSRSLLMNTDLADLCMYLVQWNMCKPKKGGKKIAKEQNNIEWTQLYSKDESTLLGEQTKKRKAKGEGKKEKNKTPDDMELEKLPRGPASPAPAPTPADEQLVARERDRILKRLEDDIMKWPHKQLFANTSIDRIRDLSYNVLQSIEYALENRDVADQSYWIAVKARLDAELGTTF